MQTMIVAYLTFNGNTEEAFEFYKSILGGEFTNLQRFGDSDSGKPLSEADKNKIQHITLDTPHGSLMGNDHMMFMGPHTAGNNFSISLYPDSEEEARTLFEALSKGGMVALPYEKVFWGGYYGMLIDKFGIKWMVNYQAKG